MGMRGHNHYPYDCERYDRERIELEKDLERILTTHGLQHISDINIKVMTGNLEEASKTATLEPRYNTIRYNTNSDITRMRFGPQFFLNLPFFISLERKYVFQTC